MLAHIKLQLKSRGILKKACETLDFFMFTAFFYVVVVLKNNQFIYMQENIKLEEITWEKNVTHWK